MPSASFLSKIHREPTNSPHHRGDRHSYSIAKAFAQAGAARIVLASRNAATIRGSFADIKKDVPGYKGALISKVCDVGDTTSTAKLWESLKAEDIVIDVLVLNVAINGARGPLFDTDLELIAKEFFVNVLSHIHFAQKFVKQNSEAPNGHKKVLIDISSVVIHDPVAVAFMPNYTLTKSSSTYAMQLIANDLDANETQVVSFHPGAIYTAAAKAAFDGKAKSEVDIPFDDDDLPGAFSVWAASDEAKFIHGRFVWAAWDVDEMKAGEVASRVKSDISFLKVGVPGLTVGDIRA
ncbi:uncharacterized protein AB675_10801 [Cyphellophora attinorum]|uniref:Uncharacterized protein n=1 Tax=Cyphellophora attinorum TaxID=1664694 RepID=A0A0N1NZJ5_9EURO|nr:uncharacterized protein AB675_10801 [Phialophora attinorum]KPI40686.1 hypothetical protein AB675_10801 [Phialophora attinorum]